MIDIRVQSVRDHTGVYFGVTVHDEAGEVVGVGSADDLDTAFDMGKELAVSVREASR